MFWIWYYLTVDILEALGALFAVSLVLGVTLYVSEIVKYAVCRFLKAII